MQRVCSRIDHSPTLHSIVSYNTATERRHTNDGNESIRSFPISCDMIYFPFLSASLFKVTKIHANRKARSVISGFRCEVHAISREMRSV